MWPTWSYKSKYPPPPSQEKSMLFFLNSLYTLPIDFISTYFIIGESSNRENLLSL
ncbi:hypothetical protein HanRHA438_Chr10g0446171 [Helianthus annuus]|nr:hypothetical protein HanRHA438_Chr10g0446171 [Helianthus annuus]